MFQLIANLKCHIEINLCIIRMRGSRGDHDGDGVRSVKMKIVIDC